MKIQGLGKYKTVDGAMIEIVAHVGGAYPWVGVRRWFDGDVSIYAFNDDGCTKRGVERIDATWPKEETVTVYLYSCKDGGETFVSLDGDGISDEFRLLGKQEITVREGDNMQPEEQEEVAILDPELVPVDLERCV